MKAALFSILLSLLAVATRPQKPVISDKKYLSEFAMLRFRTTHYDSSNVVFVNIHENESTSAEAWRQLMKTGRHYGLVELQQEKMRLVSFTHEGRKYRIDPNRIYTGSGVTASLKKYNKNHSAPVFNKVNQLALFITSAFVDNKKLVVALHNNTNENYSVRSYLPNGEEAVNAAEVHLNGQQDEDDFFYTTEKAYFDFFKEKNYNVVWQNNTNATDDGSLSVYCAQNKIPYINVEAETGHLAEQSKMLETVLELIRSLKIR